MNEFVEECRSEWKRLGVPDPVASEMAAELTADLEEAEAEGASAEEVLGSSASEPRSFAAAWAAERGVVQPPLPSGQGPWRRLRMAAAVGACAVIATVGAVLVIVDSPSAPGKLAVASPVVPPPGVALVRVFEPPVLSPDGRTVVTAAMNDARPPLPVPSQFIAVDIHDSGADVRTVGSVLLTVGLAGFVPLMLFWLWVGPGPWSRPRTP